MVLMKLVLLLSLWRLGTSFVPSSSAGFLHRSRHKKHRSRRVDPFLSPTAPSPTRTTRGASSATPPPPPTQEQTPTKSFEYNWKEQWYALTFASYVPNPSASAEVVPAAVFGHPLVLWRSTDNGPIYCADDLCPHRAAALSEGRLRDGKIECYYHGWQFSGQDKGACTFIPQLSSKASSIPKRACLRMRPCRVVEGIVWAWMGDDDSEEPTKEPPRQDHELDEQTGQRLGCILNDFQIDLPYDWSYLVENLIDPAHIPLVTIVLQEEGNEKMPSRTKWSSTRRA